MGGLFHGESRFVLLLLVACIVILLAAILSIICIVARARMREVHLCARLIEQKEATQQAERKSMRKSKAFVEASHNIRTSLACLTTLIENSYSEATLVPELRLNLQQMGKCANELLGILNAILDTSKIEAGAVLLEEEEFDLAQLVEESVDLFHPFAMKKNVDMVLDFLDGSVLEHSLVRGDKGKLMQILSNLLHNAVKFTPDGHITVRVLAQKMCSESAIIADNQKEGWQKNFRHLFFGKEQAPENVQGIDASQRKPNSMNFMFEVDDTGKGIPKEKRESVFEDYNQIKDGSIEHGGTGLGLGSVQSLLRLMGGDIKIVDKGMGKRGTCFRFNVLLTVSGDLCGSPNKSTRKEDIEEGSLKETNPGPCLTVRTPRLSRSLSIQGFSPRWPSGPRPVGSSRVILLMGDDERRKVSQRFLMRLSPLGIRVCVTSDWTDLPSILEMAQQRPMKHPHRSSSAKSDSSNQRSEIQSRTASNSLSRGSSPSQRSHDHNRSGFVLLIIDMSAGPIHVLVRLVREFQRGTQNSATSCKVIWLDKPMGHTRRLLQQEGKLDLQTDIVISRPFHGTRLIEAIKLLPEFGSPSVAGNQNLKDRNPSTVSGDVSSNVSSTTEFKKLSPRALKPLGGKRVLVVEDNAVLQKATKAVVTSLGASVEVCGNGADAVSIISGELAGRRTPANGASSSSVPSYDFVLMDCEMPVMNGYEATRMIREEEKLYNVHIPIIALTGHSSGPEVKMTFEAGMDSCLQKPLRGGQLVDMLHKLNTV